MPSNRPDTYASSGLPRWSNEAHTRLMGAFAIRCFRLASIVALTLAAIPLCADEIRLKDGKKLYGVIVAYEENMFKVKTDFGFVLVEKDKIASIIPVTPASGNAATPGAGLAKALDKKQSSDANITDLTASVERSDPTPAKPKFSN